MGEYIQYQGYVMKIGTCENLTDVSYDKYVGALQAGLLSSEDAVVARYVEADSGFRFRFPFPDEDDLPFGQIKGHLDRSVPVMIDAKQFDPPPTFNGKDAFFQMEIVQQKLVHRQTDGRQCLALVWQDPVDKQRYRVEDEDDVQKIAMQIILNHVQGNSDPSQKNFYWKIVTRILKGYRLEQHIDKAERKERSIKQHAEFNSQRNNRRI